ncbi:hypothetical protein FisN_10Lh337 [Fistulifera solaris]|uniref:Uncharacterized protein n=1 Tax=Fistulifera solaris TaxID=1519565 RepID=A0A1Z5KGD6_FISSO|nr:hypothetical protein FisN_10Lh337 [Fistulifera solaris]|eukprot:GAX25131.1 hypothetical protein FisN_10Lh337 [Fistulifera solaris]
MKPSPLFLISFFCFQESRYNTCHAVWMDPSLPELPLDQFMDKTNTINTNQHNPFVLLAPRVGPPPRYQIGSIDNDNTEFNVGNGYTDESQSRNIISIHETSGTNHGLTNANTRESRRVPGTLYYDFIVLAPGCERPGEASAIQIKGQFTSYDSVNVSLEIYPWHGSMHDSNGNQSEFGICLQADIYIVDGTGTPQLIESKHFDFDVTVLAASFAFEKNDDITLSSVAQWPRLCV